MKKVLRNTCLALMLVLPLTACKTMQGGGNAGANKYDMTYLRTQIKPGVTTSEEIISLFGQPSYRDDGAKGPNYWAYEESKDNALFSSAMSSLGLGTAGNAMSGNRSLNIHFTNNRVHDFNVTQ
ncbi:hypothetical protein ACM5Q9_13245 [Advenella sp. RU8]|uniref:hypothetical protein n=1 Tax=Advenella sp. RU8 TaxID=3399575 RepID=UPI003AACA3A1